QVHSTNGTCTRFIFDDLRVHRTGNDVAHDHASETTYTCPMHPQIIKNEPGTCPICGMDLVPVSTSHGVTIDSSLLPLLKPVNEQVVASMPTIEVESGTRIFSIP